MIATRAITYFGASPSLRKMKPLTMTYPVMTGTTMATTIWLRVVPNYSITDLIEDLDWVAFAIYFSFFRKLSKKGNNANNVQVL